MAASNWAQMCFDHEGKPCGTSVEAHGYVIEFYKNWVYIKKSGDEYAMMSINSGSGSFEEFSWCLTRLTEQNSVAGAIWWYDNDDDHKVKGIFGIGSYAFDESREDEPYVGIMKSTVEKVRSLLDQKGIEHFYSYCGDEPRQKHEYETRVGELSGVPEEFVAINLGEGVFRNQGDVFFGVDEGTKVGDEPPEPVFMKIIEAMKEDG